MPQRYPLQPALATAVRYALTRKYTKYIHVDVDVRFLHHGQQFIWDAEKAAANLAKHGIRFEAACDVFLDPLVRSTDASIDEESREAAIGMTEDWKLLFVVHLIREDDWIRIISARPATPKERKFYEESD